MIDCDCPHCGSRNTKAFSVIHCDGTRQADYRKDGWFYYRRSFGIHSSRTRGRSQSLTAQLAAPPAPQTLTGGGVAAILFIGALLGGATGFYIALGVVVLLAVLGSDTKSHVQALLQWQSTFRCGRCGTVFVVVEDNEDVSEITVDPEAEYRTRPAYLTAGGSPLAARSISAQISHTRKSDSASR